MLIVWGIDCNQRQARALEDLFAKVCNLIQTPDSSDSLIPAPRGKVFLESDRTHGTVLAAS